MSASPLSEGWLEGLFFDGRRSAGHPARVRREGSDLLLDFGGGQQRYPATDIRLGTRVGRAASYLHLQDGGVFESADTAGLAALACAAGATGSNGWLHRLETNYRLIAGSAVLVMMVLVGSVVYGIPWVSKQIAHSIPTDLERYLGEQALVGLDSLWFEPSRLEQGRQTEIRTAFEPHLHALATAYPGHELQVLFRSSDAVGANALALPGGIVVFTDDLLLMAENNQELVAILAHEVGHVVHRHSLQGIVQSSLALWLVMSITGDLSAASDLTSTLPAILANLSYVRDMERDADDFALTFMHDRGIEPRHFAAIMLRLDPPDETEGGETANGLSNFLSTHPPTPERIKRFLDQD
ncbi:MAG TPA: M48 family metallopeptidase [Pseudomonas xinjiangensis]|uniref:M48 family metallopeptidase n=2 Tax=root TaxID=1 RepID=A0A7V1BR28_9GAMM|nr:M48 family metallopeptidase [Halopseudomonas xinjiangensis]HEC49522.1 M48 family metallopeptidase [Halopseudomonas xinjiangensis]